MKRLSTFAPFVLLTWAGPALAAGRVMVNTSEPGATIILDGRDTGLKAPSMLEDVELGQHEIVVIDGCRIAKATVDVLDEAVVDADLVMTDATGTLVIQPIPADAFVSVDGQPLTGALGAPAEVSCGSHAVAAQQKGYQAAFMTVEVGPDAEVVLPIRLQPLGQGRLLVEIEPDVAILQLDGETIGQGDIDRTDIWEGPHTLRAEAEGFLPETRQFVLEDGKEATFNLTLDPIPRDRPERKPLAATDIAGIVLGAGGLGVGVLSALEYRRTSDAYDEYTIRIDGSDTAGDEDLAQKYYDDEVIPHMIGTWAAGIASGAMIAGGLTLVFAF